MLKIKICGITNIRDALKACQYGADALGFIFAKSPRKVSPKTARAILERIPPFIAKVGVFVNADQDYVLRLIRECGLDTLQFHGEETDKYCAFFQKYCKIIKAFRIKDKHSVESINYRHADAYLLDAYSKNAYGGTGRIIAYDLLKGVSFKKPLIVAGGINDKNCRKIANLLHPFAFDVSSSIETSPGKKDLKKMKNIINKVKLLRV